MLPGIVPLNLTGNYIQYFTSIKLSKKQAPTILLGMQPPSTGCPTNKFLENQTFTSINLRIKQAPTILHGMHPPSICCPTNM